MFKKIINPLIIFSSTIVFLGTCAWVYAIMDHGTPNEFSKEAWPKTQATATKATVEYFKKEKNIDVTITDVGFSGEYATPEVYLNGHIVGNEQQKVSATVNSSKDYQVKETSKN